MGCLVGHLVTRYAPVFQVHLKLAPPPSGEDAPVFQVPGPATGPARPTTPNNPPL